MMRDVFSCVKSSQLAMLKKTDKEAGLGMNISQSYISYFSLCLMDHERHAYPKREDLLSLEELHRRAA
jgi:hypothetical protein